MAKKEKLSLEKLMEKAIVDDGEKPYDIPSNWIWTKIGEIAEIYLGLTHTPRYVDKGVPFLSVKDITKGFIDFSNTRFISREEFDSAPFGSKPRKGDVLFGRVGTIGAPQIVAEDTDFCIFVSLGFFRMKNKKISTKYIMHWMNTYLFDGQVKQNVKGSTLKNLNTGWLKDFYIPLPNAHEQQRIVDLIESLFEKLDRAKELVQNALDSFETRKSAILHKAFTGELTAKWRETNRNILNDMLKEILKYYSNTSTSKDIKIISEFQGMASFVENIANGKWYKCSIGAIGLVCNGSTPSRKEISYWGGNIPWVSSGEVKNNIIDVTNEYITDEGFNSASVKLLKKGSVLIAMIGEGKTRGQTAILDIDATINQNIASVDLSHNFVNSKYLWYWLQFQYKKNREEGNGTGPKALNCQRVRELSFILPPLLEQEEIVRILDNLLEREQKANELYDVIDKICLMKKSILARAFRGELSTNNPNEESALDLLKEVVKQRVES